MPNTNSIKSQLESWLMDQLPDKGRAKLQELKSKLENGWSDNLFYLNFSAIPRFFGKSLLHLSNEAIAQANALRPGWHPQTWTADQAGRVWLILNLPLHNGPAFFDKLEKLFVAADMGELTALYKSLAIIPFPESFRLRASEGVRTNMTDVFDAIALDNPYPADYMDDGAWNQLFLKTAFMGRPIYRILNIKQRANAALASTISDYAHERWAAGRVVTPEIWQPVSAFINDRLLTDISRLFADSDVHQQEAAALVCAAADHPDATALLDQHPDIKNKIVSNVLTWESLGKSWNAR